MKLYHVVVVIAVITNLPLVASSVEPQGRSSSTTEYPKLGKILFLGNSITLHGPAPKIGWEGNWGMAASAKEKDYVHRLIAKITKETGKAPATMVKNIADFERNLDRYDVKTQLKAELDFEADLVILAIGENAAGLKDDAGKKKFEDAWIGLIDELKKHGKPTILVCGCFMSDPVKDISIKKACETAGVRYVDNGKLGTVEANLARSERKIEHAGVAAHPGDIGMAARANSLWAAIMALSTKKQSK